MASLRVVLAGFFALAAARPAPAPLVFKRAGATSAVDIVTAIMPSTTSCAGAAFPAECATADQAAPYLVGAMAQYGLYDAAVIAGVLALTAYESGELKFRHNINPGTPGKGTSNMQMLHFNEAYAASIPALATGLAAVQAAGSDPDAVLALVTADAYNFGSGAWFLATQCGADVRTQLAAGTDAGFAAYMGCVGTDITEPGRLEYWHAALSAFGL
ncbi:hypothetical protein SPI_04270 [Niveomyces insectorum RCEF 264]|uniref:Lysozyme-like domain protein n=1 Tax=Niveomyces insectorum RCEF 264 TaxID=1081102 RepID=A0A167VKR7_9HYPO|nr:hypothetical protein SPI_04270 [Niveomyces insectorum RCEF 264]